MMFMDMIKFKLRFYAWFTLTGFIAFWGVAAGQGRALSFDEALQMVLINNEVMKQAGHHNRQMEEELKSVRMLRMPQVSLNANYIMLSDDITIDMHEIKDAITPLYGALSQYGVFSGIPNPDPATVGVMPYLPAEISTPLVREQLAAGLQKVENGNWDKLIQKGQFGTLSAGVQWPLFTGGKINAANRAAQIRVNEASFVERQKKCSLADSIGGTLLWTCAGVSGRAGARGGFSGDGGALARCSKNV